MSVACDHVYNNVNAGTCPLCGETTHEINWVEQNSLNVQWRIDNPNA